MKQLQLFLTLSLFFISLLSHSLMAQSNAAERMPLSDAIQFVSTNDETRQIEILKAYEGDLAELNKNPFLKDAIPKSVTSNKALFDQATPTPSSFAQNESGAGIANPSVVADALATFIAKRFREELTIAFLDNFRTKLKNDTLIGNIFPNAKKLMLIGDPFNYKAFVPSLRGALDEDIKVLPDNLPTLIEAIAVKSKLDKDQKKTLEVVIKLYQSSLNFARHPADSYNNLTSLIDSLKTISGADANIKAGLDLGSILIKELGNSSYTKWSKKQALSKLTNFNTAKIFIGLVIEKYKSDLLANTKINNIPIKDILIGLNDTKRMEATQYVQQLGFYANAIQEEVNTLKLLAGTKELVFKDYEALLLSVLSCLEVATDDRLFTMLQITKPPKLDETLEHLDRSAKFLIALQGNISAKDYAKVVVNSLNFIGSLLPEDKLNANLALKEFVKYSNFAINMAGANSAEEMVKALENSALPSQSYRLKRNSYCSVSLNSYAGLFVANEFLFDESKRKDNQAILVGFTAPVGVSFNWGLTQKNVGKFSKYPTKTIVKKTKLDKDTEKLEELTKKRYFSGNSFSIHIPLIDIGAIVALRLTDDDTPVSNIEWKNILAPGLYGIWGIGNTPVALGFGAQYGPQLRSVNDNGNEISSSAFRVGTFLTVDIPFFHVSAKTEKVVNKKKSKKRRELEKERKSKKKKSEKKKAKAK